jgi:bifunctional DNase/RNase
VTLHYLNGLRISEIAVLVGSPAGTVKARLHHARNALRDSLRSEFGRIPRQQVDGGSTMVEVTVHDVALLAPRDEEAKWLAGGKDYNLGFMRVILLKETAGDRILPIWVGAIEGDVIAMQLEHIETPRPMTLTLTAELLKTADAQIVKIAVSELREKTYFATMWLKANDKIQEIDARPSDAIALALHAGAPIFVAQELFGEEPFLAEKAFERLEEQQRKIESEGMVEPEAKPMEWKSFRALPREDTSKWTKLSPKAESAEKG